MSGEPQQPQTAEPGPAARPSLGGIVGRSLRLRCPRCGGGKLFHGYFRMYPDCPNCKLRYERGPGYFLGSTYINYALTAVLVTIVYVVAVFGGGYTNREVLVPLLIFVTLFPMFFFRFARSLWLGMDCFFDRTDFRHGEDD